MAFPEGSTPSVHFDIDDPYFLHHYDNAVVSKRNDSGQLDHTLAWAPLQFPIRPLRSKIKFHATMVLLIIITQRMFFLLITTQGINFKGRIVLFVLDVRSQITPSIHVIKFMAILLVIKLSLDTNSTVPVLSTLKC